MLRHIARRSIPVLAALLGLLAAFITPPAHAAATYDITQVGKVTSAGLTRDGARINGTDFDGSSVTDGIEATEATASSICSAVPSPLTATRAPWAARARAMASPMPEVLPVTSAVRPCRKRSIGNSMKQWGDAAKLTASAPARVVRKYDGAAGMPCSKVFA